MDAFFVSVELLRRPDLRGRPVVVGYPGARGVVAAASYGARAHGVHSAMASTRARRLCPDAVFLPPDHAHYREVSRRIMELCRRFTPVVEPLALDEAFLDLTGTRRLWGDPATVATRLRAQVLEHEGLGCSIGVARTKFLAKLASEAAKPQAGPHGPVEGRGVVVVEADRELEFLHPLPVDALWGVGPATAARLTRLGIRTVGQLAALPLTALVDAVGEAAGTRLHQLAHGHDDRPVVPDQRPRSISHEVTFPVDLHGRDELRRELVRLADAVAARLRAASCRGRTVQVKVRYPDLSTVTRAHTLTGPTDRSGEVRDRAWELLGTIPLGPGVRLLGVGVAGLTEAGSGEDSGPLGPAVQLSLLEGSAGEQPGRPAASAAAAAGAAVDATVDAVRRRFGPHSIGPARLVDRPDDPATRPDDSFRGGSR